MGIPGWAYLNERSIQVTDGQPRMERLGTRPRNRHMYSTQEGLTIKCALTLRRGSFFIFFFFHPIHKSSCVVSFYLASLPCRLSRVWLPLSMGGHPYHSLIRQMVVVCCLRTFLLIARRYIFVQPGSQLDRVGGLGEPLNVSNSLNCNRKRIPIYSFSRKVIISGLSSPQVLTNDGFVGYARALGL